MPELEDRVALVTAGSRGISASIAHRLAEHGARVAVHARHTDQTAAVVAGIEAAGGTAMGVGGDVTRFEDIEAARAAVEARFGPVDILGPTPAAARCGRARSRTSPKPTGGSRSTPT